jgi:hypothetical protein
MTSRLQTLRELGVVDQASVDRVALGARAAIGPLAERPQGGARRARGAVTGRATLAMGLAVTVAGAALVLAHPWGGDSADAALLQRAWRAVTPPAHSIQHILQVQRQGSSVVTTESWQSVDDPGTLRWTQTTNQCGPWTTDESSTLHDEQWFDADHDRILQAPLDPAKVRASWPQDGPRTEFDPTVPFAAAVQRGDAHVAASMTLGGASATAIRWQPTPTDPTSENVLYVDPSTGTPIAYAWGGGKLDATGGVVAHQRFLTYEFVPTSAAAEGSLSESAAHPQASGPILVTPQQFDQSYQDAQRAHCGSVG